MKNGYVFLLGDNWSIDPALNIVWFDTNNMSELNTIIFDPTFCKALWGEEKHECEICSDVADYFRCYCKPNWQHHIQQLAIAEDRIAYLAEFGGI